MDHRIWWCRDPLAPPLLPGRSLTLPCPSKADLTYQKERCRTYRHKGVLIQSKWINQTPNNSCIQYSNRDYKHYFSCLCVWIWISDLHHIRSPPDLIILVWLKQWFLINRSEDISLWTITKEVSNPGNMLVTLLKINESAACNAKVLIH